METDVSFCALFLLCSVRFSDYFGNDSIDHYWKHFENINPFMASSAFAGLFYNTQCQLKLLSAFEFWASLVADVIFAQDQIIYYLKKKLLKNENRRNV